jgi:hypothetical protein
LTYNAAGQPLTVTNALSHGGVRAFGLNTQIPYQMFLTGDGTNYSYANLNLAGGGRVRFDRISSGTGYADAVMEHTATPTTWYKARLTQGQTFFADALGSALALTDGSGTVAASYTYEAFGATAVSGTTGNAYEYTGRESDGTGLKYYRARYFHPAFQRFIGTS